MKSMKTLNKNKISGLLLEVLSVGAEKVSLTLSSVDKQQVVLKKYSVKGKAAKLLVSVSAGWKKMGTKQFYRFSCECTGKKGAFNKFAINGCDYFQYGNIMQSNP